MNCIVMMLLIVFPGVAFYFVFSLIACLFAELSKRNVGASVATSTASGSSSTTSHLGSMEIGAKKCVVNDATKNDDGT